MKPRQSGMWGQLFPMFLLSCFSLNIERTEPSLNCFPRSRVGNSSSSREAPFNHHADHIATLIIDRTSTCPGPAAVIQENFARWCTEIQISSHKSSGSYRLDNLERESCSCNRSAVQHGSITEDHWSWPNIIWNCLCHLANREIQEVVGSAAIKSKPIKFDIFSRLPLPANREADCGQFTLFSGSIDHMGCGDKRVIIDEEACTNEQFDLNRVGVGRFKAGNWHQGPFNCLHRIDEEIGAGRRNTKKDVQRQYLQHGDSLHTPEVDRHHHHIRALTSAEVLRSLRVVVFEVMLPEAFDIRSQLWGQLNLSSGFLGGRLRLGRLWVHLGDGRLSHRRVPGSCRDA